MPSKLKVADQKKPQGEGKHIKSTQSLDPAPNSKRKKKNNFRDKEIEAWAKMVDNGKIKRKPETMSYKNLERSSRRFNLY